VATIAYAVCQGHGTQNDFIVLPDFDDALG